MTINDDKTVCGYIGSAAFEQGILLKNPDLPWETGVEYIVQCGRIGKIFDNDPLDAKEVEIWLGPINGNGRIRAEIRYTEGGAAFPMAGILFVKTKD
jgi:hypothetical protein